ncbi:ThaI family type II restriction endonuclease [Helicobacter cetorum]|uniref:ThaI family type II restriction endonuclease n=1 Tax=Helicobacter cetorum TaxID=138563 RepID=UPI000CF195D8|nr:ThaI family type II restriction endonuclease [Helicobacter cetorum]
MQALFSDVKIRLKIQEKLPYLFQLVESENSRDGKLGMEIGSARERVIIALMLYYFGKENVQTDLAITQKEIDVIVLNKPYSIKTAQTLSSIKLIWTTDALKTQEFIESYKPNIDILFAHVCWGKEGGFYYISSATQQEILTTKGKEFYFKLPKSGINSRGVEISKLALLECLSHKNTLKIPIFWEHTNDLKHSPYDKYLELWQS